MKKTKIKDPLLGEITAEPFPRNVVEAVDAVISLARKNGSKDAIQTSYDWQTIRALFKLFSIMYPKSYKDFVASISHFRSLDYSKGIAREGGGLVQHQLEVPGPFYAMVESFFPLQKWDKKFVSGLTRELPELVPYAKR